MVAESGRPERWGHTSETFPCTFSICVLDGRCLGKLDHVIRPRIASIFLLSHLISRTRIRADRWSDFVPKAKRRRSEISPCCVCVCVCVCVYLLADCRAVLEARRRRNGFPS